MCFEVVKVWLFCRVFRFLIRVKCFEFGISWIFALEGDLLSTSNLGFLVFGFVFSISV